MSGRPNRTVAEVLDHLRAEGVRLTDARRVVVEALIDADAHPTADTVARLAAERDPSLHRSTVYRTLDALAELGVIDHVHLGHSGAVYHFVDDGDLHVVCQSCEAVVHVDPEVLDAAAAAIVERTGFVLDPGHFALPATCPTCAAPS